MKRFRQKKSSSHVGNTSHYERTSSTSSPDPLSPHNCPTERRQGAFILSILIHLFFVFFFVSSRFNLFVLLRGAIQYETLWQRWLSLLPSTHQSTLYTHPPTNTEPLILRSFIHPSIHSFLISSVTPSHPLSPLAIVLCFHTHIMDTYFNPKPMTTTDECDSLDMTSLLTQFFSVPQSFILFRKNKCSLICVTIFFFFSFQSLQLHLPYILTPFTTTVVTSVTCWWKGRSNSKPLRVVHRL